MLVIGCAKLRIYGRPAPYKAAGSITFIGDMLAFPLLRDLLPKLKPDLLAFLLNLAIFHLCFFYLNERGISLPDAAHAAAFAATAALLLFNNEGATVPIFAVFFTMLVVICVLSVDVLPLPNK